MLLILLENQEDHYKQNNQKLGIKFDQASSQSYQEFLRFYFSEN